MLVEFELTYSTETAEPIFIEVCLDWIHTFDYHVDAHVELLVLDQEGVLDVTLH